MAFLVEGRKHKATERAGAFVLVWLCGCGAYVVLLCISVYSALKWVQDARVGHRKVVETKRQHVGERICCREGTEEHVLLSDHMF